MGTGCHLAPVYAPLPPLITDVMIATAVSKATVSRTEHYATRYDGDEGLLCVAGNMKHNKAPSMSFLDSLKAAGAGTAERVRDILSECLCLALDTRGEGSPAPEAPEETTTPHRRGGPPGVGRRHNVRLATRPPASTARITLQLVKVRVSRLCHPSVIANTVSCLVLPALYMLGGRAPSHGIRRTME